MENRKKLNRTAFERLSRGNIPLLRRLWGVLFAILVCCLSLYAQKEISGQVFDETGKPVPSYVLKLKNIDIRAVSDTGGSFKLWLPTDTSKVEFSNHGDFQIKKTELLPNNEFRVVVERHSIDALLALSLEELSDITVTVAGKTEENVPVIPASVIIISRKDIEIYGYTSVSELLQHISGLYLIDGYRSPSAVLGVRGQWADADDNDNYAILVNNIYQFSSKLAVPLQAIDRVEIIRGPMSVIYGSGSMYGAINIVTNEGGKNLASVSYGSDNTYQMFARATGRCDNFNYTLNIGFNKSDGVDVKYKDIMGDADFSEFQKDEDTLYAQSIPDDFSTEKQLENELRYINFYGSFNGVYISALYLNEIFEQFFLFPAFDDGNRENNSTTHFTLGYQKKLYPTFSLNTKVSYQKITMDFDYDFFVPSFYGNVHEHYNIGESVVDLNYTPFERLTIVAGLKYATAFNLLNITDVADSRDTNITNTRETADFSEGKFGTFLQVSYNPVSHLRLIAGMRFEKASAFTREVIINGGAASSTKSARIVFDDSDWQVIPRMAAVYSLTDKHIFKLLFGEATQFHHYGFDPKKQMTFEFDYLFTEKAYSIGLNAYQSKLENRVDFEFDFDWETSTYSNTVTNSGDITTTGVELNFIAQPYPNFKVEVGGAYQISTDDENSDITVAYSPNLLGQLRAIYRIKNYSLGITGYYVDEMESMWIKEDTTSKVGAHRLGAGSWDYFITSANLRADDIFKGLFASLHVSNLFDRTIKYPTTQTTSQLQRGTFGPGRVITATLGWKF